MEYAKEYDSRTRSSTYRAKRVIRDGRDIKIGEEGETGKREREKKERERGVALDRSALEREMEVENQESEDKSRRRLKGGSVGVNGPYPVVARVFGFCHSALFHPVSRPS